MPETRTSNVRSSAVYETGSGKALPPGRFYEKAVSTACVSVRFQPWQTITFDWGSIFQRPIDLMQQMFYRQFAELAIAHQFAENFLVAFHAVDHQPLESFLEYVAEVVL